METRALGATGHESSVLTFGAIICNWLEQEGADQAMELAVQRGVNHVDVAPTYGDAEAKIAPKLGEHRDELFLGCKTQARTYEAAWDELEASLETLGVDRIDLYQFHAVTSEAALATITGDADADQMAEAVAAADVPAVSDGTSGVDHPGRDDDGASSGNDVDPEDPGALQAFREASDEGLIEQVGLTSHGEADLIVDAIDRIDDLATVMFPLNYVVAGHGGHEDYRRVLERADAADLGTIGIKAFAKGPWPEDLDASARPYATWYEPHDAPAALQECADYALSHDLTSITNAGDPKLFAAILDAVEGYERLDEDALAALRERGSGMDTPVPAV